MRKMSVGVAGLMIFPSPLERSNDLSQARSRDTSLTSRQNGPLLGELRRPSPRATSNDLRLALARSTVPIPIPPTAEGPCKGPTVSPNVASVSRASTGLHPGRGRARHIGAIDGIPRGCACEGVPGAVRCTIFSIFCPRVASGLVYLSSFTR